MKGEGRNGSKTLFKHSNLIKFRYVYKKGNLFCLKAVEVGVVQQRKSLQRLASQ